MLTLARPVRLHVLSLCTVHAQNKHLVINSYAIYYHDSNSKQLLQLSQLSILSLSTKKNSVPNEAIHQRNYRGISRDILPFPFQ